MGYFQTINDYLKNVDEALEFCFQCLYEEGDIRYVEAPKMIPARVKKIFELSANDIFSFYGDWVYDSELGLMPAIPPSIHAEHLKHIIVTIIHDANKIGRDNMYIKDNRELFTDINDSCIQYTDVYLKRGYAKQRPISHLLSRYAPYDIFSTIAMVAAYQSYHFYTEGEYEYAVEFCANSQLALNFSRLHMTRNEQPSPEVKEIIEEINAAYTSKRKEAAKEGAKKRIEARFKEEIFMPSWQEWQKGGIEYKNQAAFIKEMIRQSAQYLEDNDARKTTISHRTFQYWLADM